MDLKVWVGNTVVPTALNPAITHSVLSASLARSLHIAAGRKAVVTDGWLDDTEGYAAPKLDLRLDDVDLSALDVIILNDLDVMRLARSAHRHFVIGADLFQGRIVEISFPSATVHVVREPTACARASYVEHFGLSSAVKLPVIDIRVNGQRSTALIDPGIDDALVVNDAVVVVNDASERAEVNGRTDAEVDLLVGAVRTRVRPQRRGNAAAVVTVPFTIGRRAFGDATLTIDMRNGQFCIT